MLSKYISEKRSDYFLGEGLVVDGRITDVTRGTGIMLRLKNDGKFAPLLMMPNLRGQGNQIPRERVIVSERECSKLMTIGRAELDYSWTEQGYSTSDLVLLPAYREKIWFNIQHDSLVLDIERSTFSFGVAWECRIPELKAVKTCNRTYLETSRSLLFHTASDSCIHAKLDVPDSGVINYGKAQFGSTMELFEFVGNSPFIMGKYDNMDDRILKSRLTVLKYRVEELAEFRQENYTNADYEAVISRSMRTERSETIEVTSQESYL